MKNLMLNNMLEKIFILFEDPLTIVFVKASAISLFISEAVSPILLSVQFDHIPPVVFEVAALISRVVAIATGIASFFLILKKLKSK